MGKAYRGEQVDEWDGLEAEVACLEEYLRKEIEAYLGREDGEKSEIES